ncbi:MAG: hypothetical protein K2J65_06175 [Duncaniella sp.]|nr:hypothetical protein [Duncaniella sp.]
MEFFNGILTAVHEEFFGNIVGAQISSGNTTASMDYITDWSMPASKDN